MTLAALLIAIPLVIVGIAAFAAWTLFFKPLSVAEYEMAVEDGFDQMADGTRIMGEAVRDLVNDARGGLSTPDVSRYQSDFAEGERQAREASVVLAALRAPEEYARVHRDVERFAGFMLDDVLSSFSAAMNEMSAGDDAEAVSRRLVRAAERSAQRAEPAQRSLSAIRDELHLGFLGDPMTGLALSPVSVTVSWEQPVDVDLFVKDVNGSSYSNLKDRDATGGPGDQSETIVFENHGSQDLSHGRYRISAYYASRSGTSWDQVYVTVAMTLPTGAVVERERWVSFDSSADEWHVFEVDAATGEYTVLDWLD